MEDEAVNLGSVEVTTAVAHEEEKTIRKRKSLAVDETTYEMLSRICAERRRSKIQQLQVLIEAEFYALNLDRSDS
tara:strand:+ start:125 stop:349 length:225 start_codon:yes stop_codon:yes gene_type:complete